MDIHETQAIRLLVNNRARITLMALDKNAVRQTDDEFYRKHPEMVDSNGRRIPIDPANPAHQGYKEEWLRDYQKSQNTSRQSGQLKAAQSTGKSVEQKAELGKVCEDCPLEKDKKAKKIKLRASLFFDGTCNNRFNTELMESGQGKSDGSYYNDYTNVSKLEAYYDHKEGIYDDKPFSLYIEGIGTTKGEGDTLKGYAFGEGNTGVEGKVEAGLDQLVGRIKTFWENSRSTPRAIERIDLDAFGFSRGAAAARNFVHVVLKSGQDALARRLAAVDIPVEKVEVLFIGLFDTVASFGVIHSNDTAELSLDAVKNARKVVQLTAADEHRKNFRLTNIRKAGDKGLELFLPGVHSDIGGGYVDNYEEVDLQILDLDDNSIHDEARNHRRDRFEREKKWLIEHGWCLPEEIQAVNFWNELKVTRRNISNKYARIPLRLMARLTTDQSDGISFPECEEQALPSELSAIAAKINSYADRKSVSKAEDWIEDSLVKAIRHKYFHFSAMYGTYGGANEPQWTNNDRWNGARKREPQGGQDG